jgi:hypothetical protein
MFKPTMFSNNGIDNNFSPFQRKVSIAIDMIANDPAAEFKVYIQIEPQEVRNTKTSILNHKNDYDLILAWDEDIISQCENAVLFPFGTRWVSDLTPHGNKKDISLLASSKNYCSGHRLRHRSLIELPVTTRSGHTIRKHRSPPRLERKEDILRPYLFSIIIENVKKNNWFTEKLIDCLSCHTIPIYWGCPNIGDYFDTDGMIIFDTFEELEDIVHTITEKDYQKMREPMIKNLEKSKEYADLFMRAHGVISERL